jgi:hypothetical protein
LYLLQFSYIYPIISSSDGVKALKNQEKIQEKAQPVESDDDCYIIDPKYLKEVVPYNSLKAKTSSKVSYRTLKDRFEADKYDTFRRFVGMSERYAKKPPKRVGKYGKWHFDMWKKWQDSTSLIHQNAIIEEVARAFPLLIEGATDDDALRRKEVYEKMEREKLAKLEEERERKKREREMKKEEDDEREASFEKYYRYKKGKF